LLGGAVLARLPASVGRAAEAPKPPEDPAARKWSSRRIDELTSREVEFYLRDGGDIIFIPFGGVSGHGALIPMGMHGHWANALAHLMAKRTNGLIFPLIPTVFVGATRTFRGSVNFPVEEQVAILKRVANTLYDGGFKRPVLVTGTNPEDNGGTIAARALFDQMERPFLMIQGSKLLSHPDVRPLYSGFPGNFGETQICLASMKILGRERPIPMARWSKEKKPEDHDQPAEIRDDVEALKRVGAVGWRYHEEGNHGNHGNAGIVHEGKLDIDLAIEVLEKSADVAVPALKNLSRYSQWLDKHPMRYIKATERLNEK
jgi:creatinine amidohydrolase/Fe(II)-dependent formamide hydrolase-like protein